MAAADYRLCDVCGGKTFYDAELDYSGGPWGENLVGLGDWAVICEECAKTHKCIVVPPPKESEQS